MPAIDDGAAFKMTISWPENIRELVIKALVSESSNKKGRIGFSRPEAVLALNYLATVNPSLVHEEEIRELVIEYLGSHALGYRNFAAMALHAIGDPLGILNLTYNCLGTHPITKQNQPRSSGWGDGYLIRRAHCMTDECIDLLLRDMRNPPNYLHADVLSTLPPERIINRVLPLLDQPLQIAAQAAYVLAMQGRDEGRAVLEQIAEAMNLRYIELAIIGLSHIPNQHAVELIRGFTDPKHPVFGKSDHEFGVDWLSKKELLTKSRQRFLMVDSDTGAPFVEVMRRFYLLPPAREWKVGAGVTIPESLVAPQLFEAGTYCVTWAPDFIAEFSTDSDRRELVEIQTSGFSDFLDAVPMENGVSRGWPMFMMWQKRQMDSRNFLGENVLGIRVVNDRADYIFAATDWLMNPQDYRVGSHRRLLYGLNQQQQQGKA